MSAQDRTGRPKRGRRIMDPDERKAFVESRRTEDRERMAEAVAQLAQSDGWQRYVETRSRFHRYSMGNCLLIAMQCPDATDVASYKTWQSVGRQVRKGEHGIRILAPMVVGASKRKRGQSLEAGNTVAAQLAHDRQSLEEKTEPAQTRLLFKSVSVFDISQTDGEALPEMPCEPITGDSHTDRKPQLEAFARSAGFSVVYTDLSDDARGGWCDYSNQRVVVDSSKPANAQVRVLVHELAHALGVSSQSFGRGDAEVIVESVTCIVLGSLGLDTSGESIPYVASWSDGDPDALKRHAATVDEIATKLEKALELK